MPSFEYFDVEDEVVSKLQTDLSSLEVDVVPLPDDEDEYSRGVVKPRVTVAFISAEAGVQKSTNQRSYPETISFICNIQSQSLRGDLGCHTLARLIKEAIIGFQPTHCGRVEYKSYSGSDPVRKPEHKLWYWDVEFTCTKMFVQKLDDETEPDAPLLKEVILNDVVQTP